MLWEGWGCCHEAAREAACESHPGPTPFFGVWYMVTFTGPLLAWGRIWGNKFSQDRTQKSWGHLEMEWGG